MKWVVFDRGDHKELLEAVETLERADELHLRQLFEPEIITADWTIPANHTLPALITRWGRYRQPFDENNPQIIEIIESDKMPVFPATELYAHNSERFTGGWVSPNGETFLTINMRSAADIAAEYFPKNSANFKEGVLLKKGWIWVSEDKKIVTLAVTVQTKTLTFEGITQAQYGILIGMLKYNNRLVIRIRRDKRQYYNS